MSLVDTMRRSRTLPHVIELAKTCDACPSQWEGRLADGRGIYIRFRWGTLSAEIFDGVEYVGGTNLVEIFNDRLSEYGHYSGSMDDEEMKTRLQDVLFFRV